MELGNHRIVSFSDGKGELAQEADRRSKETAIKLLGESEYYYILAYKDGDVKGVMALNGKARIVFASCLLDTLKSLTREICKNGI